MQNLRKVDENFDPILSRLWTKVHEIFRRCRKPLVLSNALFLLSVSRFVQKIFAIKAAERFSQKEKFHTQDDVHKFCQKMACPAVEIIILFQCHLPLLEIFTVFYFVKMDKFLTVCSFSGLISSINYKSVQMASIKFQQQHEYRVWRELIFCISCRIHISLSFVCLIVCCLLLLFRFLSCNFLRVMAYIWFTAVKRFSGQTIQVFTRT